MYLIYQIHYSKSLVTALGKNDTEYSARISGALSLIKETKIFFKELNENKNLEEINERVLNENIFDKTSLGHRKRAFSAIKQRFFINPEVTKILQKIINSNLNESTKNFIIYYYFSKAESIVYDITTKLLYTMFLEGKSIVTKKDIQTFLEGQAKTHKEIEMWTESTRERVIEHYLASMKDFGFLKGRLKKQFDIPFIPTEVILLILFEKLEKKMNVKQILNSDDFKLFFLEKDDLIRYFEEGARMGYIRFNRAKEIYDLNSMGLTLEGYVNAVTGKV
jgi:hypothetical protein